MFDELESKWGRYWCEDAVLALRSKVGEDGMISPEDVTPDSIESYLTTRFGSPDNLPFKDLKS